MDDAIEDGVGEGRLADDVVPLVEGKLTGDERRAPAMAILDDFHQIAPPTGGEPIRPPIVEHEQIGLDEHAEQTGEATIAMSEFQIGEQPRHARIEHRVAISARASGSTGGKQAYLDRVIWKHIPDAWRAAEELAAGEVDWWEQPPLEFILKIKQNPHLQTFVIDLLGLQGWLRPNWLHPPFNNKKARQALLHMMDQVTYLAWAVGQSEYYRPCYSVFACGGPYATDIGAEPIVKHDLARARQLVSESGYDGQPIVVLHVTDILELVMVTRK